MPQVGFKPTISAGKRPKTYALDQAAIGTGMKWFMSCQNNMCHWTVTSAA